jgi:hypothetical protein
MDDEEQWVDVPHVPGTRRTRSGRSRSFYLLCVLRPLMKDLELCVPIQETASIPTYRLLVLQRAPRTFLALPSKYCQAS